MVTVRHGTVRVAVLKAAGTNCDEETACAFRLAGAEPELVWVGELRERKRRLDRYAILAIPGGFTYGDDLGAGRLLALELVYHLKDELIAFLNQNKLIIGICNGFQVLLKAGILPSGQWGVPPEATLAANDSGKFEARWVYLKSDFNVCVWTQGLDDVIELPVAHGEGKFVPKDDTVLEQLLGFGQIVFQYCDPHGQPAGYPFNPNGSVAHIAGICDPTGRILGLMPHPERHLWTLQHPRWTSEERREGEGPGLQIFRNGVRWASQYA
jgi:phosphoribosylformylglycinamidine synthase